MTRRNRIEQDIISQHYTDGGSETRKATGNEHESK